MHGQDWLLVYKLTVCPPQLPLSSLLPGTFFASSFSNMFMNKSMLVDTKLICTRIMLSRITQGLEREAYIIQKAGILSNITSIGA